MLADGTGLPITDPTQAGEALARPDIVWAAYGVMVISSAADSVTPVSVAIWSEQLPEFGSSG